MNINYLGNPGYLTHFVAFTATSSVVFGIIARYHPHILVKNLPPSLNDFIANNAWLPILLLVCGIILAVVAIVINFLRFDRVMV